MQKILRCDCGFEVRADEDDALVERVREHALSAHGMRLSVEQALELAARSEARPRDDSRHAPRAIGERT
jgi:predicted small metal-binding protein